MDHIGPINGTKFTENCSHTLRPIPSAIKLDLNEDEETFKRWNLYLLK